MVSPVQPQAKLTDEASMSEPEGEAGTRAHPWEAGITTEHMHPPRRPGVTSPTRDELRFRRSLLGQAVLRAAQRVYTQALQESAEAQRYLSRRGVSPELAVRCGLGYCRGDQLAAELRSRGISLHAAWEVGLLAGPEQSERLAGRITIPEVRKRVPIWMTGRSLDETADRYRSFPGTRPLLGKEVIAGRPAVVGVKGVFDFLTLRGWNLPAFCWLGGALSPRALAELEGVSLIYLVSGVDVASQAAGACIAAQLGEPRVQCVTLPRGVQDLNQLGARPEGKREFLQGLQQAAPARWAALLEGGTASFRQPCLNDRSDAE